MNKIARIAALTFLCASLTGCGPFFSKREKTSGRTTLINMTTHRLALNRAIYLKNKIEILEKGKTDDTIPPSSWETNRNRRELAGMDDDLIKCGQWGLKNGEPDLACQCLKLAAEIKPSAKTDALLNTFKNKAPAQTIVPVNKERAQNHCPGEDKIKSAIREGKLKLALKFTTARNARGLAVNRDLEKKLRLRVKTRIMDLLTKARNLYASGAINNAKAPWQEVLALDPGNQEARNGLIRLRKIQQRFKILLNP